jgi:hypothetical protein
MGKVPRKGTAKKRGSLDVVERTPLEENELAANPSQITQAAIGKAIDAAVAVVTARIDAMQKAQDLFQADLTRVPTTVDRQVTGLRELLEQRFLGIEKEAMNFRDGLAARHAAVKEETNTLKELISEKIQALASVVNERFTAVAAQFSERDTRTDQRAGDTKLAVDAAFAAAKEATAKIEAGFTKQIDAMNNIIDNKTANLSSGISDLKDRLTAMENRTVGMSANREIAREDNKDSRSVIAVVVSIMAVIATVFLHFLK